LELQIQSHITEAMDPILGSDVGYPDWYFCGFHQSIQINTGIVFWNRPWPLPSTSFQICHSPSSSHSTLHNLCSWESFIK